MLQEVMRNREIPPEAKAIYAYLSSIAGVGGTCYPSINTMSNELSMSRGRLTKYLKELIENGVVEKVREKNGNLYGRNVYKVTHETEVKRDIEDIYRAIENQSIEHTKNRCAENRCVDFGCVENLATNINNININNTNINNRESNSFAPPTVKEVAAYCEENGFKTDPEVFVSYYNSKGWMIGKNQMTDWKQAVITWEKREEGSSQPKPVQTKFHNFKQHQYEGGELDKFFVNQ